MRFLQLPRGVLARVSFVFTLRVVACICCLGALDLGEPCSGVKLLAQVVHGTLTQDFNVRLLEILKLALSFLGEGSRQLTLQVYLVLHVLLLATRDLLLWQYR